ncbi:MAG: hypothetical protein DLM52_09500 [Chthoniobacterales bacterium]|nr:MAG: hypothetical protein DLM52_09500 [Chthoniobacterales bacterium]
MHFDQNIIFIIVAAIVAISRLVGLASRKRQQQPPSSTEQPRRTAAPVYPVKAETDEERVRKFLEALGAPPGTQAPPKVQPRTDLPPRPVAPISPPPIPRPFSPVLLKPVQEKVRKVFAPKTAGAPVAEKVQAADEPGEWLQEQDKVAKAAAKFESATSGLTRTESAPTTDPLWRQALRSPEALRSAFILREILGPPRAFQVELAIR